MKLIALIALALAACEYHEPCVIGDYRQGPLIEADCPEPPPKPPCTWRSYDGGQCDAWGEGFCSNGVKASYYFDGADGTGTVTYTFPECRATYEIRVYE